ncbi:MAG TPA: M20 family metallopeptidase [Caulobacteraceae bacterium]|nr:M20 family metallopeptidase [Caulobacteraceae bacterium]
MTIETMRRDLAGAVEAMRPQLLALSHQIHAEPELALEEVKAAAALTGAVAGDGIEVGRGAFGLETAYAAEFGRTGGATIAILSEYDALPGVGHACGHNIIATAGLGAALALAKLGARLPGKVRYLGTPAEERFGGKELMARAGAFEGVDAAMMMHPATENLVSMPSLAVTEVDAIYHGRAAHASVEPHRGLNALDAVVTAYQAIAQLRQHIRDSDRIHGIITEGGLAANIVPERAACRFYVRSPKGEGLGKLCARVQACLEAGATASGCRLEALWGETYYLDLKTNGPMAKVFEAHGAALGRVFERPEDQPPGRAGSTDMGNVSHRVPSIHPILAVAPRSVPIHNAEFTRWAASDKGDDAVIDGAKALALTALDLMADAELMARAKADFAATAEDSHKALAAMPEPHAHAGCGCA